MNSKNEGTSIGPQKIHQGDILKERYQIQKKLGAGGMGEVFLAKDFASNQFVAVKRMFHAGKTAIRRFQREYQFLNTIAHPNLVRALDYFEINSDLFMVMEYVKGQTLDYYLRLKSKSFSISEKLVIGNNIARALEVLNTGGVLHRDIKPSNIMLDPKNGQVKILDLGIGKDLNRNRKGQTMALTQGGPLGTPDYMSPEQAEGLTDERCDVFALGITLYQLFTRSLRSPFHGNTPYETLCNLIKNEPPTVLEVVESQKDLPSWEKDAYKKISKLVQSAMVKNSQKRLDSCQAFADGMASVYQDLLRKKQVRISKENVTRITGNIPPELRAKLRKMRLQERGKRKTRKKKTPQWLVVTGINIAILFLTLSIFYFSKSLGNQEIKKQELGELELKNNANSMTKLEPKTDNSVGGESSVTDDYLDAAQGTKRPRKEEEAEKREEETRKQEEAKKREKEARKQEEAKKREEETRKQEEAKKREEEARRKEEARKREEEARRKEEARKREEEARRKEEAKKREEVKKREEEKILQVYLPESPSKILRKIREHDDHKYSFDSNKRINDASFKKFCEIPGLEIIEELDLSGTEITDESFVYVKKLVNLRKIDFSATFVSDQGAQAIYALDELENLRCGGRISEKFLIRLPRLNKLESLKIKDHQKRIKSKVLLPKLLKSTKLKSLSLAELPVYDSDLKYLKGMRKLKELDLSGTKITHKGVKIYIRRLENLKEFCADRTFISNAVMVEIEKMRELKKLSLSDSKISSKGLLFIKSKKLSSLHLNRTKITKVPQKLQENLSNLKDLELKSTGINDTGMIVIGRMLRLEELELANNPITNKGLKYLRKLVNLRELDLGETKITDKGFSLLEDMKNLQYLRLYKTKITDQSLDVIMKFPVLQEIDLEKTAISKDGVEKLKSWNRDLKIRR